MRATPATPSLVAVERADLLALVDAAPGDLPGLRGRVREWRAPDVHPVPGVQDRMIHAATIRVGSVDWWHPGGEAERWWDVWFGAPDRWRIEGDHDSLRLSDGTQTWEGFRSFVTERGAPSLARAGVLGPLLAPGALLGEFRLRPVAEHEVAGRPAVEAVAGRRPLPPIWRAAMIETVTAGITAAGGTHRVEFDAGTGIVLRHRVYAGAEVVQGVELTDLEVGEPDPAAFALPEGVTVQTAAEEQAARRRDAGVDPVPLDVRVHQVEPWGPPPADPAAAEAAVTAAFRDYTATDPSGRDLVNVHPGTDLAASQAAASVRYPGTARMVVDALRFVGPDEAAVWYTVEIDGRIVSPLVVRRRGRAVYVDGRWFVARQTVAELLALAGIHVPPPPD